MEKQELELLKQRKMDKTEEHESKKHKNKAVKEHKAVVNGKEHTEGSGTMTFSYKKLHVPKELIKKAKNLVETTTGLNSTFIQFIQQAAEEQGDKSIKYRHLKAFKAVLADLKKAHSALEEALVPEFRNMEVQNGNEGHRIVRTGADVEAPVEKDGMEIAADAADEADEADAVEELDDDQPNDKQPDEEQPDEDRPGEEQPGESQLDKEQPEEEQPDEETKQDLKNDQVSDNADMTDSQTETVVTKKTIKSEVCDDDLLSAGEMSLDHDIMSVPPSVPEELFQMVESLADSTMLLQTDGGTVSEAEKNTENLKSNGKTSESQPSQPKVKNLIVKLTPVPVVTTCGSKLSRSKDKEKNGKVQKTSQEEEDCEDEKHSPPPSRRSSRVKTTPLRKQTENIGTDESSESELEDESKGKAKSSKKSVKKEDGSQTKTLDSDSDEVPNILLEKAAAYHSTDEEQGSTTAKKRLFKSNNTSTQDTDKASKRKRKSESSESDAENKSKKKSKKKKKNHSDSSSSDSDQEKRTKGKVSTAKRRSSRVKKQDEEKEDEKNTPESRAAERRRSYEKKGKRRSSKSASKLQLSSSEDGEEQQAEGDSGEESDVQKIKPIVEDNMAGGGVSFHQSSGN